jgi:thiamine-monophosphate kinase
MLSEFDLIKQYFVRGRQGRAVLGIGDDCALLAPSPGMQLAVSSDMLVEGRHFVAGGRSFALGHKCLAVNLSDLAAMGASPLGFTLALALPGADPAWLDGFSRGLFALADEHGCELVGGDTTKGPLNVCITIFGEIAPGRALRRDAARAGDDVWISGTLGDARLGWPGTWAKPRSIRPTWRWRRGACMRRAPRVALGRRLADEDSRMRRWISRTDWPATSGTSWRRRRSAPCSMSTRCRPGRCWRARRLHCGGASRRPAGTITNCASRRRRRTAMRSWRRARIAGRR